MNYIIGICLLILGIYSVKKIDRYMNKDRSFRNFKDSNFQVMYLVAIPIGIGIIGGLIMMFDGRTFNIYLFPVVTSLAWMVYGIYGAILNYNEAQKQKGRTTISEEEFRRNYFSRETWTVSFYETYLSFGVALLIFPEVTIYSNLFSSLQRDQFRIVWIVLILITLFSCPYVSKCLTRWFANKIMSSKENEK